MSENIVMPKLGMTMKEGTVEEWHKEVGDSVEAGETVVTISSEKLTQDVESPSSGKLLEIKVEAGETVKVKEALGVIGDATESPSSDDSRTSEEVQPSEKEEEEEKVSSGSENADKTQSSSASKSSGERIFISPLARKMAKEHDLDISQIEGTGGNGRITKLDINRVLEKGMDKEAASKESIQQAQTQYSSSESVGEGLNPMRRAIAQNMRGSLNQTAQLTLHRKVDINKLMKFQKKLRKEAESADIEIKLSLTALLAKAVVLALQDYNKMNSRYEDGTLKEFQEVHLGIATSLDEGLVVPVIRNAQQKNIGTIASEIKELSKKARSGEAANEELQGSTFTITNMGASGIEYFTPILNTHETGILGVGATQDELVMKKGKVKQVKRMPLSLTFDHQIIDGAAAAEFLNILNKYIANPYLLTL